jgi:nucleoside-diphosphate-sugar epimerase
VSGGHKVVVITRGLSRPYRSDGAWDHVQMVNVDRESEDAAGTFGARVGAMEADAVIDLVCFTPDSARQLAEGLRGRTGHLLHCGTIWIYGPTPEVPLTEAAPRRPFGTYGINKAAIEKYLLAESSRGGTPTTILHPGHIVGRGWAPVNPAGNLDLDVFGKLARGETLALPNFGLETVHHVHADDVAQSFDRALARRSVAIGEPFHVTSRRAISLRSYAEAVAGWFGREAQLEFQPFERWREGVDEEAAAATYDHIAHSPAASIEKAEHLLGYTPRYTSLQGVREAVAWLIEQGRIETGGRQLDP